MSFNLTGPNIISQIQSCVVVTKASALVGLGSKSWRQLDAKHAVLGMDVSPSYINIYLAGLWPKPARKGKVLAPTAWTVVLWTGRKHGCLGWLRSFFSNFNKSEFSIFTYGQMQKFGV